MAPACPRSYSRPSLSHSFESNAIAAGQVAASGWAWPSLDCAVDLHRGRISAGNAQPGLVVLIELPLAEMLVSTA